jgi:heat shock protein HtpX
MKRIGLFLATNLAVILLLTAVIHLFGLDDYLAARGQNYQGLLVFAAIFGFGGAFFSLAISKWMAKRAMGVRVITQPRDEVEAWLVDTVRRHAETAHIGMPEVGIFDSPQPNAFATGASKNNALVAVSTGLLRSMRRDEVEAVLGHEVAHVANGDMVTLTLIQGVVNTFVIFLARVIGSVVDSAMRGNNQEGGRGIGYFVTVLVSELVLGLFASMIVAWFSRRREFRADEGGAYLAGAPAMIGALVALKRAAQTPNQMPEQLQAFGITAGVAQGLKRLFMSHPPLEERIQALEQRTAALGRAQ